MNRIDSTNKHIVSKYKKIVRVIVTYNNGAKSVGTGFIVNEGSNILTCWHVISGNNFVELKTKPEFIQIPGSNDYDKVDKYMDDVISRIEIELADGVKFPVKLTSSDYYYDIAVLGVSKRKEKLPHFELAHNILPDYLDEVQFWGYPESLGYSLFDSPFAVNTGSVSAFPNVEIAGGKYRNIQLNSICIGGNSGAPLFRKGDDEPFGIINGYYWKGRDNFALYKNDGSLEKGSLRIPLNISYATSFNLLLDKSEIFRKTIEVKS